MRWARTPQTNEVTSPLEKPKRHQKKKIHTIRQPKLGAKELIAILCNTETEREREREQERLGEI